MYYVESFVHEWGETLSTFILIYKVIDNLNYHSSYFMNQHIFLIDPKKQPNVWLLRGKLKYARFEYSLIQHIIVWYM